MVGKCFRSRWCFALTFSLCVFFGASYLRIWTAWHTSPWEAWGEQTTFWTMLASIPTATDNFGFQFHFELYSPNLVILGLILGVSFGSAWGLKSLFNKLAQPTNGPLGSKKR